MSMSTRLKLVSKLGIDYPIFLSPMAGVSTIDMSIGVSNNGGLGSIPLASIDFRKQDSIEKLENLIIEYKKKLINSTTKTKTKTKTKDNDQLVVNLNFFCHEIENEPNQQQINNWKQLYKQSVFDNNTEDDDAFKLLDEIQFINGNVSFKEIENNENHIDQYNKLMEYLEQLKPSIISFHFGMPSPKTIKRLQNQGIMIFITSTSLEETIYLTNNNNNNDDDDAKIDGIILQGYEAGGHRGNFLISDDKFDEKLSTHSLFIQLKQYLDENVTTGYKPYLVPAGGIIDIDTINYYLSLGADAVQMGTAFLATPECINHKFFNTNNISGQRKPTIMIDLVSGKFARTVTTDFITNLIKKGNNNNNYYTKNELPSYGYAYHGYKSLKSIIKNHTKNIKDIKDIKDIGFYLAGQNYYQIEKNKLTQEIMKILTNGIDRDVLK